MTPRDRALARLLARPNLADGFERWLTVLEPGAEHPTDPSDWAGALALIETGVVEAVCRAGGHRTFRAGELLALGWLPLQLLRNPSGEVTRILAVRRAGVRPKEEYLRVGPFRRGEIG